MNYYQDTIIALATPSGVGAISVIRLSGSDAFRLTDKLFRGKTAISSAKSHTIHYGKLAAPDGEVIDDLLVSVFRDPNSYTGEDIVELSSHGNPLISQKIISQFLAAGARPAEPGEFTKRAFLNNRLDLVRAEAVAEVINSRTAVSLRGARDQLDGLLSLKVNELRSMLINTSSLVELELDFAEEDVEFVERGALIARVNNIIAEIDLLLSTYSFGRVIRDGINLALAGEPNVGKSSLLNYLLKESRAIVSEIPGTTRDIIREEITINGILYKIYDTAGIRETFDPIEIEGVKRSRKAIVEADLVIYLYDPEHPYTDETYNDIIFLKDPGRVIKVVNKIDLADSVNISGDIKISVKTGEGITGLLEHIKKLTYGTANYSEQTIIITSSRHHNCLARAKESLQTALTAIDSGLSGEFIAVDLARAAGNLGEIIGLVTSEDVLNNIFMKFCIGK